MSKYEIDYEPQYLSAFYDEWLYFTAIATILSPLTRLLKNCSITIFYHNIAADAAFGKLFYYNLLPLFSANAAFILLAVANFSQ